MAELISDGLTHQDQVNLFGDGFIAGVGFCFIIALVAAAAFVIGMMVEGQSKDDK